MRPLIGAAALELSVIRRYGVLSLAAGLTLLWTAVLAALPAPAATALAPYLLFLDTAGFGALLVVALLLFERVEGADLARNATPVRPLHAVAVRVALLTAVSAMMAPPLTLAATRGAPGVSALALVLAGVALVAALFLTVCLALGTRSYSLQGALLTIAPAVVPLILGPMPWLAGVLRHPVLYAVPTTAPAELIRAGLTGETTGSFLALGAGTAWTLACVMGALLLAVRPASPATPGEAKPSQPRRPRANHTRSPLAAFAAFDTSQTLRDPLLAVVGCAPLMLALVLRWGYPPVVGFVEHAYGFHAAPHASAIFAAFVLLHVPVMVGSAVAIRVAEDVDDGTLLMLRVSPLSVRAYLGYRAATASLLTAAGLGVTVPLSGLAPPLSTGLVAAVALATAQAPLVMLLTAALAANKVEALVVLKGVGAVGVLLPALLWALPAPWWWPLTALAPTWALLALPGYPGGETGAALVTAAGIFLTTVTGLALARRIRARIEKE